MMAFLLKVWGLARPYRTRLWLGVIAGIIGGLLEPLMIATVTFVYALVFPSANAPSIAGRVPFLPEQARQWLATTQESLAQGVQDHPTAVVALVALIPAVLFLRGLFSYLNVYLLQWTAIRAITDLRIRLFAHLINLPLSFYNRTNSGELMSRIMNDTSALQQVISQMTSVMVKDPVTLVSLLAYLLYKQPTLTLISLVVLPVCVVPIAIFSRNVRRASRAMQTHMAGLSGVMSEAFTGNRIIKAYNLEGTVVEQFRSTARQFISNYMRIVRSSETPGPLLEFIGSIGLALVLVYLVFHGGIRAGGADFLAIILAIFSMYRPLKNVTRLHNNLHQARAASERVFELLAVESTVAEPAKPKPLHAAGAPIRFDHVSFAYGDKQVLSDFSLTVQPGELVALVGASGSGKTTLTSLLLRFYDPQEGSIRIGDVDLRDTSTRELRNQIAVVTQETILFNNTIRRNIELGRPGATHADIEAAARHAHAHDFILEKPQGYDTIAGEKGVTLSGGQRQRLAIARAILKDAPILVLDEATSALDTESERAVQDALEELMEGRTTLCIAHRLSTIQKADVIVVLSEGSLVEKGTHAELLRRGGHYQRLHDMQFRESTPEKAAPADGITTEDRPDAAGGARFL